VDSLHLNDPRLIRHVACSLLGIFKQARKLGLIFKQIPIKSLFIDFALNCKLNYNNVG